MPDSLPSPQTTSLAAPIPRSVLLIDAAWFLFWAVVSSLWCVTAASQLGATFDEPIYVQRGLDISLARQVAEALIAILLKSVGKEHATFYCA